MLFRLPIVAHARPFKFSFTFSALILQISWHFLCALTKNAYGAIRANFYFVVHSYNPCNFSLRCGVKLAFCCSHVKIANKRGDLIKLLADLYRKAAQSPSSTVCIACADDANVLAAVDLARDFAKFVLVGDINNIRKVANMAKIDISGCTLVDEPDPAAFVGLTLDELFHRFGVPGSVFAARGIEEWQDDVVFVYEQGDFYLYRNRVWQVGVKTLRGINTGDPQVVVSLALGANAQIQGDSIFYPLTNRPWPMMLRCDFDSESRVQAIFVYRADL